MPQKQAKNGDVKFVNFDFDKATKAKFKQWATARAGDISGDIERLLDDGYNLSVKFDSFNDCYAAYLTPQQNDSPLHGWILSGRGATAVGAILGALYRHYVVFEGVWPIEDIRRVGLDDD